MQFRVLGSLEVLTDAGDAVGIGGASQRRLLAVLLVDAGSVVSVDRLCDVLDVSESALRTAVSRLRRAIDDTHLVTEPPGYRLMADDLDAARFEALCGNARDVPPDRSADTLDDALGLWSGPAYAEFADQDWARPEAVRLNELRAAAVEDRAEALIAVGRFADSAASIEHHRAEHPLRDRPTGLTMRALAAQGRQAEALRAYQDHYRYLADELGTPPSAELIDLERRIASGWHDDPPAATAAPVRTNLPIVLTSFVGRADDVTKLQAVLADHRLVTLVGPGGIGKTRLAVQAAAELVDQFPDGTWLIDLAPLDDPAGVPQVIASTLAVPETAHRSLTDDIVAFLRTRRLLVILDNCEHVVDAAAAVATQIIGGCPEVTILATSREALAVDGEQVWPVPPLGTGDAAVELFGDRAREVAPTFELDAHRDAVEEICNRLDGVPLAIELAATRVQSLAPADIARLLDDRFRLLSAGRRSSQERHRTLRATVEWSYDLLDDGGRLLFARLSVFTGWFNLDAARAIAGGEPDGFAAVEGLERLVEQSMVVVDDRAEGRRYRLLETLRQYGLERLASLDPDIVRQRHAHHYRDRVEQLRHELQGPDELRALADLDDGWDNLRTAHLWAIDHEDTDTALRISAALVWECWWRHRFEASTWARAAVELPGAADHPAIVEALVTVARAFMIQFHVEEYAAAVERATTAHHQHGGPEPMSLLFGQETVYWFAGDLEGLGQQMHTILAAARARNDHLAEAHALADLSALEGLLMEPGRHIETAERSTELAAEALVVAGTVGNPTMLLWTEQHLRGWMDESDRKLLAIRPVARRASELRNMMVLAVVRAWLAELEVTFGDQRTGALLYREHLRRLIDAEAWWSWPFIGTGVIVALAAIGARRSAAMLFGELEDRLTVLGVQAEDAPSALATISEHLAPDELAELLTKGRAMTPADAAPLALAEFDAYLAGEPVS